MTLRPNSVVSEVLYDADTKRATGVRLIDAETQEVIEYKPKLFSFVLLRLPQLPF